MHAEKMVVVHDSSQAFAGSSGLALVGRTVDLETLVDFDRLLRIVGTEVSNIQYLGGLSLLISFKDKEAARDFLDAKVIWGPWFSKLELWNGQSLSYERVVWLKVAGVPLHILESGTLEQIGTLFGKVLHTPKLLEGDQDLSVCRVGILVGESSRISELVALKWKDRCYRVWVEEDKDDWIPDCLGRSESVAFSDTSPMQSSPVGIPEAGRNSDIEGSGKLDGRSSDNEGSVSESFTGKGNNFNKGADSNGGSIPEEGFPKVVGDSPKNIFYFKSKKRSRRCGRRVNWAHSKGKNVNLGESLDSSEKARPIKRNRAQSSVAYEDLFNFRAQEAVSRDLFSLDRLLDHVSGDKVEKGVSEPTGSSVP
ncbi:hypothetical protein HanRHA438_Chr09g0426451 [Helianthus annuus]|uniref:DUF4283 domain-containing protein n=1 Tax=Helianthus annuus TaxID=4232 RepID=A0A9K3IA23_HELAN|nr:hypothetical protein HanXRQr2_Chr09g0414211 [Helianthus annuus]KAJ0528006.1 hypothetical protein HanHA300_Chr09g0340421 [Helianthus annuus]KAJ0536856.1 hypothetical protein HanIR_Chr09g0446311 [Helianthus annuus]KAJ0544440.1 hypothetical protein HanHA89_Chr09g0361701 [Helianthus annuus]KAJ0709443.1 hypothetical protein HanLR1_Chr09g0340441 [Helianthus annuus]